MRLAHQIVLATLNHDKLLEFKALFSSQPEIELISAEEVIRNASKINTVEVHSTLLENAVAKARLANQASHYPSLADDSGLEVEALNGRPGVHTHRYATPKTGVTQDQANIEKLLLELRGHQMANRKAKFVTCLALVMEGILLHSTGILEGTIAEAPRGENGFGYDPIFIPQGSDRTLAEMTEEEKNAISHRARALQELMQKIKSKGIILAKP